jgi:hypothetical protein
VLITDAYLSFSDISSADKPLLSISVNIAFTFSTPRWPHNKIGAPGSLHVTSNTNVSSGHFYGNSSSKWEVPPSLPVANFRVGEIDISMTLESDPSVEVAQGVLKDVRYTS